MTKIHIRWKSCNDKRHSQKLNIWVGLIERRVIGSFIIHGHLTSNLISTYGDIPALIQIFSNAANFRLLRRDVYFQQDGVLPHVRDYLNEIFPERRR